MLELEDALTRILAAVPAGGSERIALAEATGRVLAEELHSPIPLPPFDNSAMDGYAVRAADTQSASASAPVGLRLIGRSAAGDYFRGELAAGQCIRLFTGSVLPSGADAVVMQEDTRLSPDRPDAVLICDRVQPNENIRRRGDDISAGALIGATGEVIGAGHVALLAATGVSAVTVGRQPTVGLLATGSELREPGAQLAPGQIYESNRHCLAALVRRAGGKPITYPLVADALDATALALRTALNDCDLIITSGGVSVGEMDFVKAAFEKLGGKLEFWKVAIRPGKPFVFGGCGRKFLFGLPGNPVSAFVTFLLLARPALMRWQGARATALPEQPGRTAEAFSNSGDRRHFLRVRVDATGLVHSTGRQASHALGSLAAANGLLSLPPNSSRAAGENVMVLRWD